MIAVSSVTVWVATYENVSSGTWAQSACTSTQCNQSSLSAWRNFDFLAIQNVPSEDSDQTAQMHRLIWIFAGCANAQTDLNIRWPHMLFWLCDPYLKVTWGTKKVFFNDEELLWQKVLSTCIIKERCTMFTMTICESVLNRRCIHAGWCTPSRIAVKQC